MLVQDYTQIYLSFAAVAFNTYTMQFFAINEYLSSMTKNRDA